MNEQQSLSVESPREQSAIGSVELARSSDRLPNEAAVQAQLALLADLFRHHHELIAKTAVVYLTAAGFMAGYVLQPATSYRAKLALIIFMAASSVHGLLACRQARRWMVETDVNAKALQAKLALNQLDLFRQGFNTIRACELVSIAVLLGAMILLALGS